MRLIHLVLPALALADQNPLIDQAKGWFDKAKSYIPTNPLDAGASIVTAKNVDKINIRNYERKLAPKLDHEEEWMIYFTGGNKSCFGRCGHPDTVWNQSVPLLLALPQPASGRKLRLGQLSCDKDEVLCTALSAGVPSIHHFLIPTSELSPLPKRQYHVIPLNITTVSTSDITSIPSTSQSTYLLQEEYTGAFHPFDGTLAQLGLLKPLGYVLWVLGNVPSWAFMILISFVSRNIMSRRMTGRGPLADEVPAPAAAAPPASPNRAAAAGGKKKK